MIFFLSHTTDKEQSTISNGFRGVFQHLSLNFFEHNMYIIIIYYHITFRYQPKGGENMSLVRSILTFYVACLRCSCIKAVRLRQKVDRRYPPPLTTERHALRNHSGRPG